MAKKAAKEGASKSDAVRAYIAKNPGDSPKSIVEGLKADGVTVSPALASKIKYGRPAKGGGKKGGRRTRGTGRGTAVSNHGTSQHGNKAEAIRAAAKSLGKKVRPRDVIAMLKEQGIAVSSAQVSTTLKSMGMRRTRRGRMATGGPVSAVSRPASRSESITIEDLIAAKKLVAQIGSIEAASQALSALAKLS
jgi:arginine repressor